MQLQPCLAVALKADEQTRFYASPPPNFFGGSGGSRFPRGDARQHAGGGGGGKNLLFDQFTPKTSLK